MTGTGEMIAAGMIEIEGMTETGGMMEATIGTVATIIGAPTEIVALATTETEETIAATTEIGGMVGIVATREEMIEATIAGTIATAITMSAAVSAMAEMSKREELMTGERIGEVQKRRRLIGMGRRREAPRKLLLRRA